MKRPDPAAPRRPRGRILFLGATALLAACASGPGLVDVDSGSGFALYRSGRLGVEELAALCRLGVEEILVLDGTASERECRLREELCPVLRVRYDVEQDARAPLDAGFLTAFDRWIGEARAAGRKVAFRCTHGWHRTGRLVAYYRLRHQGALLAEAIAEMRRSGRFMWWHPSLDDQVRALGDHAASGGCAQEERHCVRSTGRGTVFPADACAGSQRPSSEPSSSTTTRSAGRPPGMHQTGWALRGPSPAESLD